MRTSLILAGAMLLPAAMPTRAQPPEKPATPELRAVDPVTVTRTTEIRAIGPYNFSRIATDRAYADQTLAELDRLAAADSSDIVHAAFIKSIRAAVFAAMGRREESAAIIDQIVAGRFADLSPYEYSLGAASFLQDARRIAALVEAAARHVPAAQRDALQRLPQNLVEATITQLDRQNDQDALGRFYEALAGIDWPGDARPDLQDYIRLNLVDFRLSHGNSAGAAALGARIRAPARFLRLITLKRYDVLFPAAGDRQARVRRAFEDYDRATARALAAQPDDFQAMLNRVEFLQSVGRFDAALAILRPHLSDLRFTAAMDWRGVWIIEYAAYALLALGRTAEGVALYARLIEIPIRDQPNLLDPSINYASFLWLAGRHGEALAHAQMLVRDFDPRMNDYTRAWTWSAMVCALAGLGRAAEARPWLDRLETIRDAKSGALTRAYLCVGDMAAAEAFALHRLRLNSERAVASLQQWQLPEAPGEPAATIAARMAALRARPAVAEGLGRVGHVLSLPASRIHWGGF